MAMKAGRPCIVGAVSTTVVYSCRFVGLYAAAGAGHPERGASECRPGARDLVGRKICGRARRDERTGLQGRNGSEHGEPARSVDLPGQPASQPRDCASVTMATESRIPWECRVKTLQPGTLIDRYGVLKPLEVIDSGLAFYGG